jgi:hypothetical protein
VLNLELTAYSSVANKISRSLVALLGPGYENQSQYLSIQSIKSGSVILNAELFIPPTLDPAIVVPTVSSSLIRSSTIGGVQVLAVSVVTYNGQSAVTEQSLSQKSNTLTIVLATVLPFLGLVILVLAGIYLYRKYKDNALNPTN